VQRTTVSGVAKTLEHRGLIRQHHGHVEVIDRDGLEEACCECYQAVEDHFSLLLPEVSED
ncbi:MAG: helix-turn-helix domain-containing protein, partial [Phenylobacterium sp.]|nr:helix-turn-helix domain-containing protein [Phenylobacterium sp.]